MAMTTMISQSHSSLAVGTVCRKCGERPTDDVDVQHIESYGVCWSCFHVDGQNLEPLQDLPGVWHPVGWLPTEGGVSFAKAVWAFRTAADINTATRWWLGDLLNHGESKWGDKYTEAIADTGLAYETLARYAWVARKVEFYLRRINLSWTHHVVVAALPPGQQRYWLDRAAAEALTTRQLTEKVGLVRLALKTALPRLAWIEDGAPHWAVRCPGCHREFDLLQEGNDE